MTFASSDPHEFLSDSQRAVLDAFRVVLRNEATLAHARAAEPLGFDAALWDHLCSIGAPSLGLTGGGGVGLAELVVMSEAIGRSIAAAPIIEHVVAARLIERLGAGHVPHDVADGSAIATIALRPSLDDVWHLAPAGAVASVVVGAHGDDTVLLRSTPSMSALRNHASAPLAHRSLIGAESVDHIGGAADLDTAITEWQLLTAASLVGIAHTALELAVEYVKDRHQFGVPIGSFQAVQHSLADLPGMIDGARLLVHEAAWAMDRHSDPIIDSGGAMVDLADDRIEDGPTLAAMAFLFAADVAATATHRSLHVHGGYGFSEEYDIQLLHRRARGWALIGGDVAHHYRRLADRLIGGAHTPARPGTMSR